MIDDEKLGRINAALGYWSMIDLLTQDSLPDTDPYASVYCTKKKTAEEKPRVSVSHQFKYDLDKNVEKMICAYTESDVINACRKRIGFLSKKEIGKTDKEVKDLAQLKDAVAKNAFPHIIAIDIFLGIIPREPVITALEEKLAAASIPTSKKRQEIETDDLASALVHLDGSGVITGLEISPAIWLLARSSRDMNTLYDAFKNETEALSSNIIERYGRAPATFGDLKAIVSELLPAALQERIDTFLEEHPVYKHEHSCHPLSHSIISYQAFDDPERKPFPVTLHSSFYSKDITAVHDAICNAKNNGNPKFLAHGQLKLVLSYLEGGLEQHNGRDVRRLDIQSAANEAEHHRVSSFYQNILSLSNTPLGRWPSKFSLSLMQQTAVNLVAGRELAQDSATTDVPISDLMSVNGPPGTGKTTLLKDIIAANIVEKARLLSSYEKPDDAFTEITGVDKYLKYAKHAYLLVNPKIADLGIIVCSSNNTAVENISEELPQSAELLDGLEKEEKDPRRERAMFRGDIENDRNLFETPWKIKQDGDDPKGKRERKVIPDLYFSRIACEQFNSKEKANASLGMLISARLGKKDHIDSFRETTLEELIFASDQDSRENHLKRFELSRKAFSDQYNHVEELMGRYANRQKDVLRLQTSVKEARLRLTRAESNLSQATHANENAKRQLSDALSNSILQLKSNEDYRDRLSQINDIRSLRILEDQLKGELAPYTGELERLKKQLEIFRQSSEKSNFLSNVFNHLGGHKKKPNLEILKAEEELTVFQEGNSGNERLARFRREITGELKKLNRLAQAAREAQASVDKAETDLERAKNLLDLQQNELAQSLSSCPHALTSGRIASITGENPEQRKLHDAHLFTPAAEVPDENELRYERDKLFLRALQVTRDFILSSNCMASNFKLLNAYWGATVEKANGTGKGKITFTNEDAPKIVPALFQTLSILTPVISTTFASAGRLFRDIPIANKDHAPLGLCIVDEAGQAVPHAAIGILARCDKALVVGDPYQIEPVVDPEVKMFTELLGKSIDFPFKSCTSSVQALADATNPIGHYRTSDEEGREWIGCPLIVHRRCVSPMFEISNEISYGNSMLNETAKLDPKKDKEKLESFYLPSSQWINVAGHESGNKDHYVVAQGERAKEIVLSAFTKKRSDENSPSLYIISPFGTVVTGIRKALERCRPDSVNGKTWESFLKNNIGTVHKFQGKEAQEVIFMLGCDNSASGAVQWVNSNIVNVAASRAKQRLYVIADYNVWNRNPYVSAMKRILDTAWIDLLDNSQANDGRGIEEVRSAVPRLESLPTDNLESIASDSDGNALSTNTENTYFDTSAFLQNVRPRIAHITLSQSVCNRFGFEDEDALDTAFAACVDADSPISNPVLANIKMGMFLYDLFDIDRRSSNGDKEDWSFCAIMFCRAAELLLKHELLPSLKSINPSLIINGKQNIADVNELSLGQYSNALCGKETKVAYGMAAGYRCGNCDTRTETIINSMTPRDPAWWNSFGNNLGKLRIIRNDFCHSGRNVTPDIKKLLARLFDGHIEQANRGKQVALLCEARTLEIAKEGIGSRGFPNMMRELKGVGLKEPDQTPADIAHHTEQSAKQISTDSQRLTPKPGNHAARPSKQLQQAADQSAFPKSNLEATTTEGREHQFDEGHWTISKWSSLLKSKLANYPGLSDGAREINIALEEAGYVTSGDHRFTQRAFDSWDVQEKPGFDKKTGRSFVYSLYSHGALIEALGIYNAFKDKS